MVRNTILMFFLTCSSLFAQVQSTVTTPYILSGIKDPVQVGELLLVSAESKPVLKQVGLVVVDTEASIVRVKVSDSQRRPVEVVQVPDEKKFLILATGKFWVEITCVDFTKGIFDTSESVIEIGSPVDPVEPDQPDGPGPAPQPSPVPDDRFDNIGKRVSQWSAGLPKRMEVSAVYAKYAELLKNPGVLSINSVSNQLVADRTQILLNDAPRYLTFVQNLTADFNSRINNFDRTDLSEYWQAVSIGLAN